MFYREHDITIARIRYLKSIRDQLRRFSESNLDKLNESDKPNFQIAVASVSLYQKPQGILAEVEIDEDPYVAYDRTTRSVIEGGTFGGRIPDYSILNDFRLGKRDCVEGIPMRMSAGGSIMVLVIPEEKGDSLKEYVVIGQKDKGPVIHSEHLIPSSGLSEDTKEWLDPEIIVCRETVEEIRLLDRAGNIAYCPEFHFRDIKKTDWVNEIVSKTFNKRLRMGQITNKEPMRNKKACVGMVEKIGMDTLHINWENHGINELEGLLVLDPVFGALDLMGTVRIELPVPLSEIQVLDGEGDNKKDILFNRPIFLLEPVELKKLFDGEKSSGYAFRNINTDGQYIQPKQVLFSRMPWINPPLWDAGPALLGSKYHMRVKGFSLLESEPLQVEEL